MRMKEWREGTVEDERWRNLYRRKGAERDGMLGKEGIKEIAEGERGRDQF